MVTGLFVANTHTQLLFFTTDGMVYKLKTWRLPQAARRQGQGHRQHPALPTGVSIAAVIVPMDGTRRNGTTYRRSSPLRRRGLAVRLVRNRPGQRQDRHEVRRRAGHTLVNARIASNDDDVMLVTDAGRAITPATDVLVFPTPRNSVGVRSR